MAVSANDTKAIIDTIVPMLARADVLSGPVTHAGSSRVYRVAPGWPDRELRADPSVTPVVGMRDLDAALAAPDRSTILVRAEAAITFDLLIRACERSGLGKTVFFEER